MADILISIATSIVLTISAVLIYFKYVAFKFWVKRNVPSIEPTIPIGNIGRSLQGKESMGMTIATLYKELKTKGHKHAGLFVLNLPIYLPLDLDIIKHILIKDFQHFVDRGTYHDAKLNPLSENLFSIEGLKWKNMRNKLSPTFTSGKMKMMFDIIVDRSNHLNELSGKIVDKGELFDVKEVLARYTTDIIGSCAFGLDCNSLEDPKAEFRMMGKKMFEQAGIIDGIKFLTAITYPSLAKLLKLKQPKIELENFFIKAVKDTVDYRETNDFRRKDFLQLMIDLKNGKDIGENDNKSDDGIKLTMLDISAQSFVFFMAGFETSSTAMTFCLYELAKHHDIQEKLRKEISTTLKRYEGKMTYEGLMEMQYLDKVINETLRKYPPVPVLDRICTQTYRVPGTELILEKGTKVMVSIYGIHHDPDYYPDPEKFDPERFNDDNKAVRNSCTFLPFGEGPRNCIGLRFGMMQTKAGLTTLISNYCISLGPEVKDELEFLPPSFILSPKDNIMLKLKRL